MEEKFRVYDVENNTYVNQHHNPIFMDCETGEIYLVDYVSPDPKNLIQSMKKLPADKFIVEQDTGLKDKSGRKIYDGDILMTCVGQAKVFYDYEYCMWKIFAKHGTTMPLVGKKSCRHLDYEVIGNIHENKELLK